MVSQSPNSHSSSGRSGGGGGSSGGGSGGGGGGDGDTSGREEEEDGQSHRSFDGATFSGVPLPSSASAFGATAAVAALRQPLARPAVTQTVVTELETISEMLTQRSAALRLKEAALAEREVRLTLFLPYSDLI
jgi:hypothetical protein